MKVIYKNTELQHNTKNYSKLINKPSLNGQVLQGNVSLDTLSLYNKSEVKRLVDAVSQIRLVTTMPADPEPNMTYYVGPNPDTLLYDVVLVNGAKQQIRMGTTQFGQYKSGPGINVRPDNTININTDDVSVYIDSEGNIASSLDGEALPAFIGATSSTPGQKGLTPKPLAGQQNNLLRGDSSWVNIIDAVYPVGAIFLTYDNITTPNVMFPGTTWDQLASGYALWNDDDGGGGAIEAGIPNITGAMGSIRGLTGFGNSVVTGAFYMYSDSSLSYRVTDQVEGGNSTMYFDASRSSPIYGSSNTVQPPAIKICAWRRAA